MFAVVHLPRPRVLRLVSRTTDPYRNYLDFAFADPPALLIRASATGFTILRTKNVDIRTVDADFRRAVLALLQADDRRRERNKPTGLPPPGTKHRDEWH